MKKDGRVVMVVDLVCDLVFESELFSAYFIVLSSYPVEKIRDGNGTMGDVG